MGKVLGEGIGEDWSRNRNGFIKIHFMQVWNFEAIKTIKSKRIFSHKKCHWAHSTLWSKSEVESLLAYCPPCRQSQWGNQDWRTYLPFFSPTCCLPPAILSTGKAGFREWCSGPSPVQATHPPLLMLLERVSEEADLGEENPSLCSLCGENTIPPVLDFCFHSFSS